MRVDRTWVEMEIEIDRIDGRTPAYSALAESSTTPQTGEMIVRINSACVQTISQTAEYFNHILDRFTRIFTTTSRSSLGPAQV